MALFDTDQIAEITAAARAALGLEEGQELSALLDARTNDLINKFDKRLNKDREKDKADLETTLGGITAALEKLGEGGGGGGVDPPEGLEGLDLSKLPAEARQFITALNQKVGSLTENFEAAQKKLETEAGERKKMEEETSRQTLRSSVRDALLSKDQVGAEFDPDGLDLLVDHLEKSVTRAEKGDGYVYQTGIDEITKDPVLVPLPEGLKKFAGTNLGKRFQRARPGAGGTPPGGTPPGTPEGMVPASSVVGMDPAKVRELSDAGKIDFTT